MPLLFLLVLFLFLYAEVALVIEAGSRIGALGVIAAFAASAALGLIVIRRQGLGAYRDLQRAFAGGADPVAEISNRFLLLVAGFLLLVPGFLTDAFGLFFLLPLIRGFLIRRGAMGRARVFYSFSAGAHPKSGPGVIEGEYRERGKREARPGAKRLPGDGGP